MRYLLDTHALIWFLQAAPELPNAIAERIEDADADVAVSTASFWEMAIKISIDKLRVPYDLETDLPRLLAESSISTLEPSFTDFETITTLPFHHRDPFDRLLIAQAKNHKRTLISRDKALDPYDIKRLWG
ncbi:MAG: PIN domain nuclease of toxin-antitoxin system [Kiritimatiellia bacterium]|jgi:PIN domain nuclease of toxin-antitoxin system